MGDEIYEEFTAEIKTRISAFLQTAPEGDLLDMHGALADWEGRCKAGKPLPFAICAITSKFLNGSGNLRRSEGALLDGLERLQGICDAMPEKGAVPDVMWAILSGAPDIPAVVVGRSLECGNLFAPELEHFLAEAPSDELEALWHTLRRRRRARTNGRDVDLQEASVMEYVGDMGYQHHEAESLLMEAFWKIVRLARQVEDDCEGQGLGKQFRNAINQIPDTLDAPEETAETRLPSLQY